jgi:aquaporin Z
MNQEMRLTHSIPWSAYASELVGTAVLLTIGLSVVILAFGQGSPVVEWIPSAGLRRLITGFLFGSTGALIALSPIGKHSGAHINPAVSLSFCFMEKLSLRHTINYSIAQFAGAVLGTLPLLAWGTMGRSVHFGATLPGPNYGAGWAFLGEIVTTFALVTGLFLFLRHRRLRPFTPALFPPLYAVMVFLEAPISGTSTNPARSFGPAVISGQWQAWWVYLLGPLLGVLLGVALYRFTPLNRLEIEVAKIFHFEHDPHGIFHPKITQEISAPTKRSSHVNR